MKLTRRQFLILTGALAAPCAAACGASTSGQPRPGPTGGGCTSASSGDNARYCLAAPVVTRVPGAARLASGAAVLFNIDDNNAVIVARDDAGLHALSAICTHACCIVALCADSSCSSLTATPPTCSATPTGTADPQQAGILCPCHGSTFRLADGTALTGPATKALPSLTLTVDGDDVLVDTGRVVDAATRVPVSG